MGDVLVVTATCAIDVAAIREFFLIFIGHGSILGRGATDGTAVNVDYGLHVDMAVFATAIHGALNVRTSCTEFTNVDLSVGCKRQAIEESTNRINLTTA